MAFSRIEAILNELSVDNSRNASQRSKVACAGIYNAGKSTLLNTLIGKESFKVGDVPTTASIDSFDTERYTFVGTPDLMPTISTIIPLKKLIRMPM